MKSNESEEMYLETILLLKRTKGSVRSLDIAEHLSYSKPSVSRAVGLLKNKKYISVDQGGLISLTSSGENRAREIFERHSVLTAFLIDLGASKEIAEEDACRIEHVISDELFEILKKHTAKNKFIV